MDITDERLEQILTWHKEERDYYFKKYQNEQRSPDKQSYYDRSKFHDDSAAAIAELLEYRSHDTSIGG